METRGLVWNTLSLVTCWPPQNIIDFVFFCVYVLDVVSLSTQLHFLGNSSDFPVFLAPNIYLDKIGCLVKVEAGPPAALAFSDFNQTATGVQVDCLISSSVFLDYPTLNGKLEGRQYQRVTLKDC